MTAGIIVALDDPDIEVSSRLAKDLGPQVAALKVGLTSWSAHGPESVKAIQPYGRVFYDAKLHDIPHQVGGAAAQLTKLGVWMFTLHASGGKQMIEAATRAASEADSSPIVAAVTVLTSISSADLENVGQGRDTSSQVLRLAEVALLAGAGALVCSPFEIEVLRQTFGDEPILVVPGIRDVEGGDDQARTMTASQASKAGANYLVVGRPITQAPKPVAALGKVLEAVGG
ncbi:MAG TPA: orotidine-5'-phosphate decarboxylase [Actinomycetota bacterium]|nr:orotidine-5'-phosphate decarboxylase [Actinomycetota bacterium]